jgi:hypothetical protein
MVHNRRKLSIYDNGEKMKTFLWLLLIFTVIIVADCVSDKLEGDTDPYNLITQNSQIKEN